MRKSDAPLSPVPKLDNGAIDWKHVIGEHDYIHAREVLGIAAAAELSARHRAYEEVLEVIQYAREKGENDLRQVRDWIKLIRDGEWDIGA